ncbi:hypothetical protein [Streptomyces sp. NPDC054961]
MNPLDSLIRLCPPPVTGGFLDANDGKLPGVQIPPGHAAMLDVYGPGSFNDFLWIYGNSNPEIWPNIEMRTRASSAMFIQNDLSGVRSALAGFDVDPGELIEWGGTDNADCLFWIPSGQADSWPTLIIEAGQLDFMVIEESSPEVVLRFLEGRLNCPFFPAEFIDRPPEFESWTDESWVDG